jgi:hypothetical protein
MAIIYTYPVKTSPAADDLILISDSADNNKTKQVKVSALPSSGAGITLTTTGTSGVATLTGSVLNIPNYTTGGTLSVQDSGGTVVAGIDTLNFNTDIAVVTTPGSSTATVNVSGTVPGGDANNQIQYKNGNAFAASANLTFATNTLTVEHTAVIKGQGAGNPAGKLKLNCEQNTHALTLEGPAHSGGADYTLKFPSPAPSNQQILQSDGSGVLSWINTPSSGGGGSVDSVNTTDGTYINLTPNSATTGAVTVTADLSAVDGTSDTTTRFLSKDNTWDVPSYITYSAGTGLALNGTTFSLGTNAALTNLGGGTGTTFLRKDGTWATPQDANTNIANTNLQLSTNRTLDLSDGDASDYALTFISTLGGAAKNLFKFDQIGGTSPRFTAGHTESAYEGYVVLEGNGANRTGILQFENAAGTYYTSFQAPTTFGANQNIVYVLPNLQGAANSVLTNNGSGTLSWTTTSEPTEITSTTAVNSTTFANTPFTFANTNAGSGIGSPVATQVASQYGNKHISFYLGTTFSGAINQSGANAVNYATSSDYRLKENVVEMTGAVNRVKQLNPSRFNFIADGPSRTVDGFLAHEVSNIVPEAITGSKDAIDAEGNIIPQGIDQSKLVPLLVGAIKELTARIEALEA